MRNNQKGFSLVEVLLIFFVVSLVVFVGYYVYNQGRKTVVIDSSTTNQTIKELPTAKVKNAPAISSNADLDKAIVVLDQTDPETSNQDINALDTQLAGF